MDNIDRRTGQCHIITSSSLIYDDIEVLKQGDTFGLFDRNGDIQRGGTNYEVVIQTGTIVMTLVLGCQSIFAQTVGEIGMVGHFLGNGPWANWSGQWLALLERDGGFELREVTVSSTSNEKPVCGDMGLIVNAPPAVPDALLLRGFPAIKSGRVVTAFHGRKFLLPGEWLNVSLGGDAHWNLQAFGTVRPDLYGGLDAQFTNYQLWMTTGTGSGRRATVFSLDRLSSDKPPQILWVGVLDGDQVADIFADIGTHYNVAHYVLFLSSLAQTGQLVAEAASLVTGGR